MPAAAILAVQPQDIEHLVDDVREHSAELVAKAVALSTRSLGNASEIGPNFSVQSLRCA